jgi:hypothetical protein
MGDWHACGYLESMRKMHPRRLRNFLIGVAMFILGPALGSVAYLLIFMIALQGLAHPSFSPEFFAESQNFSGRIFLAFVPVGLGFLCGAAGLVILIANLAIHFFGQDPAPGAGVNFRYLNPTLPASTPAPQRSRDDSRFMPKLG